jgi:leucyl-tRNA synthetase
MFMGPLDAAKPRQVTGVSGVRRFLDRAWRIVCGDNDMLQPAVRDVPAPDGLLRLRHQTVAAVAQDIETLRFNTAIERLMKLANALTVATVRPLQTAEAFVLLFAPFAPHIAEELWCKLGYQGTLAYAARGQTSILLWQWMSSRNTWCKSMAKSATVSTWRPAWIRQRS